MITMRSDLSSFQGGGRSGGQQREGEADMTTFLSNRFHSELIVTKHTPQQCHIVSQFNKCPLIIPVVFQRDSV